MVLEIAMEDHVLFTAAGFAWALFLLQLQHSSVLKGHLVIRPCSFQPRVCLKALMGGRSL